MYHVFFKDKDGKYPYEQYSLKISSFTGDVGVKFYKDENKKEQLHGLHPVMYMGDMKHIITKKQAEENMTHGLYIQISSPDRVSTFIIQFLGRTKNQPIQLNQHIYDFTRIVKEQKAFFKVKKFGTMKKEDTADLSFTFTMIPVTGRVAVTFRACKKSQILCLGDNFIQIS